MSSSSYTPKPKHSSKKKTETPESTAEEDGSRKIRKRQNRGKRTRKDNKKTTGMGTGKSQTLDETDHSLPQCSHCSSLLKPVLDSAGHSMALLQCPRCPAAQVLCQKCLFPCSNPITMCTNKSCQLVSLLLTCDLVTNPLSHIKDCPQFRACPECYNLMMHEKGCKYVTCTKCNHQYCFICLCSRKECTKDKDKYWSLTCSKPRAARQRFKT